MIVSFLHLSLLNLSSYPSFAWLEQHLVGEKLKGFDRGEDAICGTGMMSGGS